MPYIEQMAEDKKRRQRQLGKSKPEHAG